tara:strand:+ start:846 stop:986 length:141 start_codon:yes stop_codon:yes gene_type:complete
MIDYWHYYGLDSELLREWFLTGGDGSFTGNGKRDSRKVFFAEPLIP